MKHYRHKFNTIGYGHYVLLTGIFLIVAGLLCNGFELETVGFICMATGGLLIAVMLLIIAYELHQDRVLNEEAIAADEKLEEARKKKSFVLQYNGGEIWAEHLDGLYTYKELVLEKFKQDIPQMMKPSGPSAIAVALTETKVDDEILKAITHVLQSGEQNADKTISKVAFVGLDRKSRRLLKKIVSENQDKMKFTIFCTDDFEKAKEWLV